MDLITLNPRHEVFVNEFISNGFQADVAAQKAGYSGKWGQQLLKIPEVLDAIEQRKKQLMDKYHVTQERVVRELALLGFSNMADYIQVQKDGTAILDMSALTRDQAAAISQMDSEVYVEKDKDGVRPVKKIKIRLHDKKAPLELLGKFLNIFKEENKERNLRVQIVYASKNGEMVAANVEDFG